eukprot:1160167-Pelagomonas_calceolata.AAC.11
MLRITRSANTQRDGMEGHGPHVSTVLNFSQAHMPLVCISWRGCAGQPAITSYVYVTKPAPQGLLQRAYVIILSAMLWRSFVMLEMKRLGQLESTL